MCFTDDLVYSDSFFFPRPMPTNRPIVLPIYGDTITIKSQMHGTQRNEPVSESIEMFKNNFGRLLEDRGISIQDTECLYRNATLLRLRLDYPTSPQDHTTVLERVPKW